jgi:hypothetical protein
LPVEVRATEFCCSALAPVFWLACRIPWLPTIELLMLTAPPMLPFVGVCVIVLPLTLAVLVDDPAPAVTFVHVFVVVWLSVPAFNTEP